MTNPRTESVAGVRQSVSHHGRRPAHDTADTRPSDVPAQLRRRRVASWRCEPLIDGRRDPLDSPAEPITDEELESWRRAWIHLRSLDLPPIVPPRVAAGIAQRLAGDAS
ncbi:MAG: hypothetical protein ACRDRG_20295 [Pseudonocardiaceae bacterium]